MLLRALRKLSEDASLIVSIPNITHLNVGAKLLPGHWDLTDRGLLDDTHLRFFSEDGLTRLFSATGWRQVEAADAEDPDSFDQRFPADAPTLRPGTPARELLRRLRSSSEPNASTYQFVRRFIPDSAPVQTRHRWAVDPEPAHDRVFASVLVQAVDERGADPDRLTADLAAQNAKSFETLEVPNGIEGWNQGINAAVGRYLMFLDEGSRVSPDWIEAFQDLPEDLGGRVLKAEAVRVGSRRLREKSMDELIASGKPLEVNSLDPLSSERPGPTVLPAYAIPGGRRASHRSRLRIPLRRRGTRSVPESDRGRTRRGEMEMPISRTTVAVADRGGSEKEAVLASVASSMDRAPLILPAGSATTRILSMRRAMNRSIRWKARKRLGRLKRRLAGRRSSG